jgi:hypothetical protein
MPEFVIFLLAVIDVGCPDKIRLQCAVPSVGICTGYVLNVEQNRLVVTDRVQKRSFGH